MSSSWTLDAEAVIGRGLAVRRYGLANGLRLLAVVDDSAPIIAFQTWFRVGSRDERPGRTGMAHLFEHLMFNQTATLGPGEFDRVVEREMVSSIDAQMTPFRDPSLFRLSATCARGHQAADVLAEIDLEIAAMAAAAPSEAELAKAKNLVETDFWSSLVDADGKAEALGHYETTLGDFRELTTLAERLAAVTAEDVLTAVRTYLVRAQRSTVVAEPDAEANAMGDTGDETDDDDDDESEDSDDGELS